MKTLKFSTLLIALVSVFTFSSCLNDNVTNDFPTYSSYVTIIGDATSSYKFYSDFGCTLIPTQSSIDAVLPGLNTSKTKRAVVAFDLASESENGKELEKGKTYHIILRQSYYSNYAIPTYNTINISANPAAADSLINQNCHILKVNKDIWAANGYINADLTVNYDPQKTFYLNTYFDKEKDINKETNTLYLNLYYNSKSNNSSMQGNSVFSFDLPEEVALEFAEDSINVVLRAIENKDVMELVEVAQCRIATVDFFAPQF